MEPSQPPPPFQPFRDRSLSLWQSAVEDATRKTSAAAPQGARAAAAISDRETVRRSDPAQAATMLAAMIAQGPAAPSDEARAAVARAGVVNTAWNCNKLAMQVAWAELNGNVELARRLREDQAFSTCDPLWLEAVQQYVRYFRIDQSHIPYRTGGDYVLEQALPTEARIALLADWGTGTHVATRLLQQIAAKQPHVVFHLGDIYYSCTRDEAQSRFQAVFQAILPNTPVFSLAGNHDMYSGGEGYYWLVDQLNQRASYFSVRNADWQFLAMDTGLNDYNPLAVGSTVTCLTEPEAQWHRAKIQQAGQARTVLLSHHQLFSAYDPIGGQEVNQLLLKQFEDLLPKVDVWFWGHEHTLSLYAPYLGLRRGRCIGCGSIPVFVGKDAYKAKFDIPLVDDPRNPGQPIRLGEDGPVYRHAYAIMELNGRRAQISYYQDGDAAPLYVETIAAED